ncbi:MAG TPA: hypothetical protein VKW76_06860 [Candidatus Binatia bacterium]|nr:hypothetical protein [Candidatus Binatia bacterium]
MSLIRTIEKERGSRVLVYVTAGREPPLDKLSTGVGLDILPLVHRHLDSFGKVGKIDLLLQTLGGHTIAPHPLVDLLREYGSQVSVLVPHEALSSGTLIALGANEIVMGPMGRLGPVDPSVDGEFNPQIEEEDDQGKKRKVRKRISVEDVAGYLALARDKAGLDVNGMAEAMRALTNQVHPLALGNVHRKYQLIRALSKRLLGLHLDGDTDKDRIENIVSFLTEKLYDHLYRISPAEAKAIGLPVVRPPTVVEDAMWSLYLACRKALYLDGIALSGSFALDSGLIESTAFTHSFVNEGVATTTKNKVNIELRSSGWRQQ